MRRLALMGASGHGKVVADIALEQGWGLIDFFDDVWPEREKHGSWFIVGGLEDLKKRCNEYDGVLVSIGDCRVRWLIHQALIEAGAPLVSLIHPTACVSRYASIGTGTVVMPGAVVNVDTVVGDACIVNTGATVDHDCSLAKAVHISPGAHLSGTVSVGMGSWIGVGATVKQGIDIGSWSLVGAGAVVVKPVADGVIVVGNPARVFQGA